MIPAPTGFKGDPIWILEGSELSQLPLGIRSRASNGSPWPKTVNTSKVTYSETGISIALGGAVSTYGVFETPDKPAIVRIVAKQANGLNGGWGAMWFLGGPSAPPMPDGDLGEIDLNETGCINRTTQYGEYLGGLPTNNQANCGFRPMAFIGPSYPTGYYFKNINVTETFNYWDLYYAPGKRITCFLNNAQYATWTLIKPGDIPEFPYSLILNVGKEDNPAAASWHTVGPATGAVMEVKGIACWTL